MKNNARVTKATGLKFCHTCGLVKMVSEYHRRNRSIDGLQTRCKSCQIESVLNTAWLNREANRDKVRLWKREYGRKRRLDPVFRKRESERTKAYRARMKADR